MWSETGWKRITIEQAVRLHPGGTVSARSGLFMCELCGQYVSLTDGNIKVRYFKHSASEKSKDCPERTFGANAPISYAPYEHDLPIRITVSSVSSFRLDVGFVRVPKELLGRHFQLKIMPKGMTDISYVYARERLNSNGLTYLYIGERPFEKYNLSFKNGSDKLYDFWPEEIKGIDPEGTLFEKKSGRKLTYDADVEIGKEYYLLRRGYRILRSGNGMQVHKIMQKVFGYETWNLYVVSASEFNENTARFYLDFHCRLTSNPVSMRPIWPLFVEDNYLIKHNQDNMLMLVEGNAETVKTFPDARAFPLYAKEFLPTVYKVFCSGRQQLISVGRTHALEYTYFWKQSLNRTGAQPQLSVTDLSGNEIASGEADVLPEKSTLCFKSAFDGELIISNSNRVIDKRKITADKYVELDELTFGLSVQVVIGLDIIWQINFKKRLSSQTNNEAELLKWITEVSGAIIPAPHALRNILSGVNCYPQICRWIRKCINNGTIKEQSYRRLQNVYRSINTNR